MEYKITHYNNKETYKFKNINDVLLNESCIIYNNKQDYSIIHTIFSNNQKILDNKRWIEFHTRDTNKLNNINTQNEILNLLSKNDAEYYIIINTTFNFYTFHKFIQILLKMPHVRVYIILNTMKISYIVKYIKNTYIID